MRNGLIRLFGGILAAIWGGYVLSVIWQWFIVPTFNAPVLSIPIALGIWLVVSYVVTPRGIYSYVSRENKKNGVTDDELLVQELVMAFLFPLLALFMGWIYTLFI
jgi:hypothetical protein